MKKSLAKWFILGAGLFIFLGLIAIFVFDGLKFIFGYLPIIIGAMCVILSLIAIIKRVDCQSWRLIQSKVTKSDVNVDKWHGRHPHTSYTHELSVEYEVDGNRYTYEPLLKTCYSGERKVRELCEKFPVGATIWARVNWNNPRRIVLEGYETLWRYVPIMLFGIVSVLSGLFLAGWLDFGPILRLIKSLSWK